MAAALALALALTALLLAPFPTWPWPGGDAFYYANITETLAETGSFDLSRWPPAVERSNEVTLIRLRDGSIYSIFPIGLPLTQLPAFALGRLISGQLTDRASALFVETLAFTLTPALLYGFTAALLYLLLRRYLGFDVPWSLLGVALYCFATLALFFSRHNGVEPLQTFLLAWMVHALLCPGPWSSPIVALSFGWSVVTKPPSAVVLPIAGFLYVKQGIWRRSSWLSIGLAVAIGLGCAALFLWYNYVRAGDPLSAYPTAKELSAFSLERIPATLWPVLLGPDRNVFLNNPVFFLALPGVFLLRDRTYRFAALGCWALYLLFYGAGGNTNWGAYVGNTRYLVPLGFLLIPFALAAIRWAATSSPRLLRIPLLAAAAAVICSSLYVQLLYTSFSEFHVKHFERLYNRVVLQGAGDQLDITPIDEARHQLRFAHALFWHTSGSRPSALRHFPYPSAEPERAAFAALLLRRSFDDRWFRKNYIFLNDSAFPSVDFFDATRLAIALATCSGLAATGLLARRAHVRQRRARRS